MPVHQSLVASVHLRTGKNLTNQGTNCLQCINPDGCRWGFLFSTTLHTALQFSFGEYRNAYAGHKWTSMVLPAHLVDSITYRVPSKHRCWWRAELADVTVLSVSAINIRTIEKVQSLKEAKIKVVPHQQKYLEYTNCIIRCFKKLSVLLEKYTVFYAI